MKLLDAARLAYRYRKSRDQERELHRTAVYGDLPASSEATA